MMRRMASTRSTATLAGLKRLKSMLAGTTLILLFRNTMTFGNQFGQLVAGGDDLVTARHRHCCRDA